MGRVRIALTTPERWAGDRIRSATLLGADAIDRPAGVPLVR